MLAKHDRGRISYAITADASPDVNFQNTVRETKVTLVRMMAME